MVLPNRHCRYVQVTSEVHLIAYGQVHITNQDVVNPATYFDVLIKVVFCGEGAITIICNAERTNSV